MFTPDTVVVNVADVTAQDDDLVRIDTGDWACPYRVGVDGSRPVVVAKYRGYLSARGDLLDRLDELRGKRLVCWCPPLPCHGDVLVEAIARDDAARYAPTVEAGPPVHGCAGDVCRVPGCEAGAG